MTCSRIHRLSVGIIAIAIAIAVAIAVAVALSSTTVPASARTFSFNSTGSMIQQPLPPKWACEISRALNDRMFPCRDSVVR